jgi:hypothetical protein
MDTGPLDARTVRKNTSKTHCVAKNPQQYVVPAAALNAAVFGYDRMPHQDEFYPAPEQWLEANASRFQFTDQQILDAAIPQFLGNRCSIERWCQYPQVCGIYFLVANKEIIYVGQSNCIPRRIFQHRDNLVGFDSLAWFEVPELFLNSIETYYITRIRPLLNGCAHRSRHLQGVRNSMHSRRRP